MVFLFAGWHWPGWDGQKDVWVWDSIQFGCDELSEVKGSRLETGIEGMHWAGRIYREYEDNYRRGDFVKTDLRLLTVVQDDIYPGLVTIAAGVHVNWEIAEDGMSDFEIAVDRAG